MRTVYGGMLLLAIGLTSGCKPSAPSSSSVSDDSSNRCTPEIRILKSMPEPWLGEFTCDGQKIHVTYSPGLKDGLSEADVQSLVKVIREEVRLWKIESITSLRVTGENKIEIMTLVESESERNARLEAAAQGYLWLASSGRFFNLVKKDGQWVIDSKGEWISHNTPQQHCPLSATRTG